MTKKKAPPRVAVIDGESDPFLYGRKPQMFAWGFYDGVTYQDFWGTNFCTDQLIEYLERIDEPLMIYAHNGGKFDFMYLVERGAVNNPIMLINGRLVKVGIGKHELRDSFSIIPVALKQIGKKEKIDYEKFEESRRERHRAEILHYLAVDCEELYKVVSAFHTRFGPMLTVGSTAIKELDKLHPIRRGDERHDALFRPFYYGGRVSVFEPGVHKGNFKVHDVNGMYPAVMRNSRHPYGTKYLTLNSPELDALGNIPGFEGRPYFAELECDNRAALPVRTKDGLSFDQTSGSFLACSHEIRVGLKHKLIDIHRVNKAWVPLSLISFGEFVDYWAAEKAAGKIEKNKTRELFAKFMSNSSYGKFGQNPAHYYDYYIKKFDAKIPSREWELHIDYGEWEIWRKPSPKHRYFDVAIAASITSAARAELLDAIMNARRPMYCDTDSNIGEGLDGVALSDTQLGAWKLEAEGVLLAIAGKKMYALFNRDKGIKGCDKQCTGEMPCKRCGCVKMASKGADLEPADILALARGKTIVWRKAAPTYRLGAPVTFIERHINRTGLKTDTMEVIDVIACKQLRVDNRRKGA